ncbi:MAG: DUF4430 domain-containing protein [Pseudomonadales bacterium]|nr:DUF4430 domain-containing protein [Pseudomonadales bacterium]
MKKLASKFVILVIILLILVLANSILGKYGFIKNAEKIAPNQRQAEETKNNSDNTSNPGSDSQIIDDFSENMDLDSSMELDSNMELNSIDEPNEIESITYVAENTGDNAFSLLQINADIEFKQYDFGVFVNSINGIIGDENHFWALYVNGEKSPTGADKTDLKKGDLVEWRYEEIK